MHKFPCERPLTLPSGQEARCRRCGNCIQMRQRLWMARAWREASMAPRTWWITFTFAGEVEPSYAAIQRFLKVLRKSNPTLRYLVTEERGDQHQRLHWHMLLHCESTVTKRKLEAAWPLGFIKARLALSSRLAAYMAKYAGKRHSGARASPFYGQHPYTADRVTDGTFRIGTKVRAVLAKHYTRDRKLRHDPDLEVSATPWPAEFAQSSSDPIDTVSVSDILDARKDAPIDNLTPRALRIKALVENLKRTSSRSLPEASTEGHELRI